jgi:ribosomal protein S12 methylthiotransferase
VHYLYPEKLDERLLELLRDHPKVLPYVDMPLQHAAPGMLRRMLRGGSTNLRAVIERLRENVPDVVLRSAFIVGHPGETEAEFAELAEFIEWAEIDHVGVFQYSDEETCSSHALSDKVDDETTEARASALIELQRGISRRKNQARVGSELTVLVEGASEESELVMIGRHAGQAPEVDGVVYLSHGPVQPGTFCRARVVSAMDYDLLAEAEPSEAPARRHKTVAAAGSAVRRRRGVVTLRTIS